jgi:hypothetical protein
MSLPSKTPSTRNASWQTFAKVFSLQEASGSLGFIRQLLNEPVVAISSVYRNEVEAMSGTKVSLYFLDYEQNQVRPMGHVEQLVSVCMLVTPERLSDISIKATRKAHKILESIGASASGGSVMKFDDPAFDDAVTVYARDLEETRALLHSRAREILRRALWERDLSPTFLLGEKVLMFSHTAPASKPTKLAELERLAADLLSLYAVIAKSEGGTGVGVEGSG